MDVGTLLNYVDLSCVIDCFLLFCLLSLVSQQFIIVIPIYVDETFIASYVAITITKVNDFLAHKGSSMSPLHESMLYTPLTF